MLKIPFDPNLKDEQGWVEIPSKFSFWIVLLKGTVYITNTRRSTATRIIDQFSLSDCSEGYTDKKGIRHAGVEAVEKISEGFCLKVKLKEHSLIRIDVYVMCFENEDLRDHWAKSFSMVSILRAVSGPYHDSGIQRHAQCVGCDKKPF